jgi:hypothetical protein
LAPFRSEMTDSIEPVLCNFEEIKRQLDPAYSYMIFEKFSESGDQAEFQQIFDNLRQLDLTIHEWGCFRDEAEKILRLMVRFDPGQTSQIMQDVLNLGLPDGITFYACRSPMAK